MSRATINTGGSNFNEPHSGWPETMSAAVLKVAILGDFSGRSSRGECAPETIGRRQAHKLTKSTFEIIFEQMQVGLRLPVMERFLYLQEYEDLHPDYLYSRVPLFRKFIELEQRLQSPTEFSAAAEEIEQWQSVDVGGREPFSDVDSTAGSASDAASMLDAILSSSRFQKQYSASGEGQIDQLIKDIVAPYIQQQPDRRQPVYLQAVQQAASEAMRKIMHHSDFKQLEASWRSLQLLLRRLPEHPNLELYVIDVSKEELQADFAQAGDDLEQSQIYKCLLERQLIAGGQPYNLIVGDYFIADDERDAHCLIDLATIAEAAGSALLLGADTRLAGCTSLAGSVDPDDWQYSPGRGFAEGWQAIRDYSASQYVSLASPRFMLRLPYGADSATTDCFDFEELTEQHGHNYYLWGNGAYLLAMSICQQFIDAGRFVPVTAARYEDLPLHVRNMPQGRWITPCAEALLTDAAASKLEGVGLSVLRSVQGADQIILPKLQSLAGVQLCGPWSN